MLVSFRRLWIGWNVLVRGIVTGQSTILMAVTWVVGVAPVGLALKLLRRPMIDRAGADPTAPTYRKARPAQPMDMKAASRMF